MLELNTIKAKFGATHRRKRLGRGAGSGHGPTAGKGDKGQLQRSGGSVRPGFEGGQMPLYRRIPKKGFTNSGGRKTAEINLVQLEKMTSKEVTLATLTAAGIVKGRFDRLAILATGEVTKAFIVKAHRVSGAAQEKIKKAGGQVEMIAIPGPQPRENRKTKKKAAAAAAAAAK
jgi:large subunit ribosomal protein L15